MQYILGFVAQDGDEAINLGDYMSLIPSRFFTFLKGSLRDCIKNILC